MQQILRRIFQAVGRPGAPIGLDFWHLMEKLSAAIKAAGQDLSEYQLKFKKLLRTEYRGIEKIEIYLRTWAAEHAEEAEEAEGDEDAEGGEGAEDAEGSEEEVLEPLQSALTYIRNNREAMRYERLVKQHP